MLSRSVCALGRLMPLVVAHLALQGEFLIEADIVVKALGFTQKICQRWGFIELPVSRWGTIKAEYGMGRMNLRVSMPLVILCAVPLLCGQFAMDASRRCHHRGPESKQTIAAE